MLFKLGAKCYHPLGFKSLHLIASSIAKDSTRVVLYLTLLQSKLFLATLCT